MKVLHTGVPPTLLSTLTERGHLVASCDLTCREDLIDLVGYEQPNAVVINLDKNEWIQRELSAVRKQGLNIPIVGISAPNCASRHLRRAAFLEQGGNDLLEFPVEPREFMASIDSLYRLFSHIKSVPILEVTCGSALVAINFLTHRVSVDHQQIQMSTMEYRLFEVLCKRHGEAVQKCDVLEAMYCIDDLPEHNSLEVFMTRIRRKLKDMNPDTADLIETLRGFGYRLNGQPT